MSKRRFFTWGDEERRQCGTSLLVCLFGLPMLLVTLSIALLCAVSGAGDAHDDDWPVG